MSNRQTRVLPVARSLIVDCAHPQAVAISTCVYPAFSKSPMVSTQFIPSIIIGRPIPPQGISLGRPISGSSTLRGMKEEKERSPFGERLFQARTHAKLTQAQLAQRAGMSQGTIGQAEWTGDASMATARLAEVCGVRAVWLAEGEGEMVDRDAWPFPHVDKDEILALAESDLSLVEGAMLHALALIHSPNPEDVERFNANSNRARKRATPRKKSA
jgi:DNA-binding XRE family transcriptional regulator